MRDLRSLETLLAPLKDLGGWVWVGGRGGGGWGLRLIHDDATHTYAARYYVVSRSPYLADILLKS